VPPKILVVEDDTFTQRVVLAALRPRGYDLSTAPDGATALARALVHPPDLVISDVVMPGMDGWSLVRRVRSHHRLALVPFIFLTSLASAEDVLRGFRLGADDYLSKPFLPGELLERVDLVLARRDELARQADRLLAAPPSDTGMHGSLGDIGASSLLVLLEMEKKGGILTLSRQDPPGRCRLLLREGRVLEAHVDEGPPLRHAEAVYHVLGWSRGHFEFHAVPVEMRDEIGLSTTGLLMEAARLADERQHREATDPTEVLGDGL
jgi:CheY-like chemotaxis protein